MSLVCIYINTIILLMRHCITMKDSLFTEIFLMVTIQDDFKDYDPENHLESILMRLRSKIKPIVPPYGQGSFANCFNEFQCCQRYWFGNVI